MTNKLHTLTVKGIGVDAVEIARFKHWHTYSDKKLLRIFSVDEIAYCRACEAKSAERFAARFAAREALYKALCQAYPHKKWVFLSLCKSVDIKKGNQGQPELIIAWHDLMPSENLFSLESTPPQALLSLTHTDSLALAWVLLQTV